MYNLGAGVEVVNVGAMYGRRVVVAITSSANGFSIRAGFDFSLLDVGCVLKYEYPPDMKCKPGMFTGLLPLARKWKGGEE